MEVKPGYKQTEVGVIPEDWETPCISEVCKLINGRGFKPYEWQESGLPIIRIQNLNGSDEFNYFQGSYDKKIEIEPGQLLFAWSGSRGTSFGPHVWPGPLGLLNYHTWKVQVNTSAINSRYFLYALKQLTAFIEDNAHGASALVHTQKWEMEGFKFPLPKNLAEQEAIAEALSDADALIESLEKLIAKKRQIKQGAMQELLTGQRRLPGFSGEWESKQIGDEIDLLTGFPFPSQSYTASGVRLLRGSNVKRGVTDWNEEITQYWPEVTTNISQYQLQCGDIVISMDGSLVGKSFAQITDQDLPALLLQRVARIRSKTIDMGFLKEQVCSTVFSEYCDSVKTVTAIPHISPGDIRAFTILIPPSKAEQTAIATILTEMDADIEALEAKLAKARQLKQAMMQELLTGRIRLV